MKEIQQAQQALGDAKANLKATVQRARRDGHTWAEIGTALNMTRQAAFKRFGEVTNPATGKIIKGALMSIEQITKLTERVFELISAGKYDELEPLIHPDVREELPASLIAETWARVLAEVGAKESLSDSHVALPAGERILEDTQLIGTVVGVTTINCEAGEVMGRVAVDDQLRIVGLLLVSPEHTPLPF
ncbi:hypothetical protein [Gulosibacter chungangensis]|uniref:DUF3887 domain-containing protein n=1 Tax=Gulosibacter chungangensis TaxID=979746 RepID=A0A7J5BFB2_9MICO|nr:hypothetical protein [Gulosibacter chungangensis]KAB1644925.1 hypothetical protein F8O05_01255 [Gulosibacter chungangensis]